MYFTNNQDSPTMYLRASPATQFPTIKPGGFLKRNYKIVLQKIYLCGEVTSHIHTPIVFSEFQLSIVPYPKYTWPEIVAAPQRSAHFRLGAFVRPYPPPLQALPIAFLFTL